MNFAVKTVQVNPIALNGFQTKYLTVKKPLKEEKNSSIQLLAERMQLFDG